MKISTRGRYALRMLLDISLHRSEGYIALKDISARQDISKKYLEQIIPVLNGAGFLKTSRGYQGGYSLAKEPAEIRVGDILRATEGSLNPVACMEDTPNQCPRYGECLTLPVWEGLEKVITEYLDGITLQDILDRSPVGPEYCI